MNSLTALLAELVPGTLASGAVVWLLRGWISERLKHSIEHEYSAKLENLKNELNARLEAVKHENEVNQLRTSLFFDHQRNAFAEILAKVAEVNQKWWSLYETDIGLTEPVPIGPYRELQALYIKHQLFLDPDSIMAMELLFDIYRESLPFDDGSGEPVGSDPRGPYDNAEYLQPRLAALFQQKIGIAPDSRAVRQLALLGSVRILNNYHFPDIELPVRGDLKLLGRDGAAEAVMRAERNFALLVEKMKKFQNYLQTETGFFHEAEASLERYLAVLGQPVPSQRDI